MVPMKVLAIYDQVLTQMFWYVNEQESDFYTKQPKGNWTIKTKHCCLDL